MLIIKIMSNFAVIKTGGKQYVVRAGEKLKIEKLNANEGDKFEFNEVLLISDGSKVEIGTPHIKGAKVEAEIIKQGRGRKIIVFKYHAKTRYRKKKGHRQYFTEVKILKIPS